MQGKAQWEIAEQCKVTEATISYDLGKIREQWRASTVRDFDEMKAQELARIDHLEATLWEAWEASKQPMLRTVNRVEHALRTPKDDKQKGKDKADVKGNKRKLLGKQVAAAELVPVKNITEKFTTEQVGNPEFTRQIAELIKLRMQLLQLVTDVKVNVNNFNWDQLSRAPFRHVDTVEQRVQELLQPLSDNTIDAVPEQNGQKQEDKP
jgi:hypothetical protein